MLSFPPGLLGRALPATAVAGHLQEPQMDGVAAEAGMGDGSPDRAGLDGDDLPRLRARR